MIIIWFIYLFVYLFMYLFIYLFVYLFIYYLFQYQQNIRPHFKFFFYLSEGVFSLQVTAGQLVCLFCMSFIFLAKCSPISLPLTLFICLFGCYPAPLIIFANCLYCYRQFWFCNTIFVFINHHPSCFISFFHPSIGGEFKTWSSSGMIFVWETPFFVWVSRLR